MQNSKMVPASNQKSSAKSKPKTQPRQIKKSKRGGGPQTYLPRSPLEKNLANLAPFAFGTGQRPKPHFRTANPTRPGSDARFIGCDYLGSVTGSNTGPIDNVYGVSPLYTGTFPRLSAVGTIYGKYQFNRLRFTCVGVVPATFGGAQTGAPKYEVDTLATFSVAEARNCEGQDTKKLWENTVVDFDCRKASVPWYLINNGGDALGLANFGEYHHIIDQLSFAGGSVGDLFCEYDVEFCEGKSIADPELTKKLGIRRIELKPDLTVSKVEPYQEVQKKDSEKKVNFPSPQISNNQVDRYGVYLTK